MSRTGESIAIVLIAVAFGAAHLPVGALAAVAAGLIGIFLGTILIIHRSIWPTVIAHGLFDASTFALLPLIANKFPELRPDADSGVLLGAFCSLISRSCLLLGC